MKRKMNGKGLPYVITALVFAVLMLAVACASTPKRLLELITYTEVIEVPGLTQPAALEKVKTFFNNAFKENLSNSAILNEDQESGIISGKLVVDGIPDGTHQFRYNSVFSVEIIDETCKITFNEPTIQDIGFISEQVKESTFQTYLTVRRSAAKSALDAARSNEAKASTEKERLSAYALTRIALAEANKTDAEIRVEWEAIAGNNYSSTSPGRETQVRNEMQVENLRGPWLKLTNELKDLLLPQID